MGEQNKGVKIFGVKFGLIILRIFFLTIIATFLCSCSKSDKKVAQSNPPLPKINPQTVADSLILLSCRSFGLSDSVYLDSTVLLSGNKNRYHAYHQAWPDGLPFLVFVQRLNGMALESNLQCESFESSGSASLDCLLKYNGQTVGRIILPASKDAKLADREIAILIINSGVFSQDDIKEVVYNGTIFNYLATPDIRPNTTIQGYFKRGGESALLKLPGSRSGWPGRFDISQAARIFDSHPTTRAIMFDATDGYDLEIIRPIMALARQKKLSYLCTHYQPDTVDSLAFSLGLPVFRLDLEPDLKGRSLSEIKISLTNRLLTRDDSSRQVICIDVSATKPGEIVNFKRLCDRIGVKLRSFMKLAEPMKEL